MVSALFRFHPVAMGSLPHQSARFNEGRPWRLFVAILSLLAVFCLAGCKGGEQGQPTLSEARKAFAAGHYSEAERLYEHYIQSRPQGKDRWEAWNRLLDMALSVRQDPNRATSILDAMYLEFGDQSSKAYELLTKLAEIYENMNQNTKALETWKKCLSLPVVDPSAAARIHYRIARNHQSMKAYALAAEELNICIRDAQSSDLEQRCRYTLAQNQIFMERYDEAEETLSAIMGNPEVDQERRALAAFLLADVFEDQERYSEAVSILESIRLSYPNPRVVDTRLKHLKRVSP
ncbi:tetratricopeptide repeat protein [Oceanidesulfovibrio indonesiensis]|nr:tetratricopeptide repeat protein [Oceanidesulfovibrio indonesiensis]